MAEVGFFEQLVQISNLRTYKQHVYTVIGASLDESFDKGHYGVYAVGGLVGRGEPLFNLDRKWEALLQHPDIEIEYFKASECESGKGQFAKFVKEEGKPTPKEREHLQEISREFISLIVNEKITAQGIGVLNRDFYEVIADPYARSVLGDDPFPVAYDLAMVQCAWMLKQVEKAHMEEAEFGARTQREYISFVRDEHPRYQSLAQERYLKLKESTPEAGKYFGSHTTADDKTTCVLQAADATVFEIRRVLHIAHKQRREPIRGQFQIFRGRMAIIQSCIKQNLLNTVKLHKPGDSFNLSDIMETEFTEDVRINET